MSTRETIAAAYATLVLILLVAACGASPGPSASGPVDATGTWRLESGTLEGAPIPLVDDWPVTLTVGGTQVSGTSACNSYGAELVVEDGAVRVGLLSSTMMACEPEVMATEVAYTAALAVVERATMDAETLVLSGPGASLRFVPVEPAAVSDIVDTTWKLDALTETNAATMVQGDPATLEIASDGTFSGSTGCRTFTGKWVESGAEIDFPEMAMDQTECPAELAAQDSHVVGVLGDGFSVDVSVDGSTLTLTSVRGLGLQYSATD